VHAQARLSSVPTLALLKLNDSGGSVVDGSAMQSAALRRPSGNLDSAGDAASARWGGGDGANGEAPVLPWQDMLQVCGTARHSPCRRGGICQNAFSVV
jgi:hypothetical protein